MKHLKDIEDLNESLSPMEQFQMKARNPLKLNNYYMMTGEQAPVKDEYYENVVSDCFQIAMAEMQVSEKDFTRLDSLKELVDKQIMLRQDEFDTIVNNCKKLGFRHQYCAETEYHTILRSKIESLKNPQPVICARF